MNAAHAWKSYRQIATQTAPPGQLVLMLYEGGIRCLERALPGFDMDDPAEANMLVHNNLQRAQDIIRELNSSLNMEQGGEFSLKMRSLYDYFERRLWESDLKKDRKGVDEVIMHLNKLREAWATMLAGESIPTDAPNTLSSAALAAA